MDNLTGIERLAEVLALRATHARTVLAGIQAQENRLRMALKALERPARPEPDHDEEEDRSLRNAEVELRWQRWAEARRIALQFELAQVLARKADAKRAVARAIGKEAALAAVVIDAKTKAHRKRARRQ